MEKKKSTLIENIRTKKRLMLVVLVALSTTVLAVSLLLSPPLEGAHARLSVLQVTYPIEKEVGQAIGFNWKVQNTGTANIGGAEGSGLELKLRVLYREHGTSGDWTDATGSWYAYSPLLPGEIWVQTSTVGFVIDASLLGKTYDVKFVLIDPSRGDRVLDEEIVDSAFNVVSVAGAIIEVTIS